MSDDNKHMNKIKHQPRQRILGEREGISTRVAFIEHMIFEQRPAGSKGFTM